MSLVDDIVIDKEPHHTDKLLSPLHEVSFLNFSLQVDSLLDNSSAVLSANYSDYYEGAYPFMYPDTSRELPHRAQVALITVYIITTLVSVIGNLLVIAVLVCGNRMKTELTIFLINLAVADLCMACFCMPFTFTQVMLGRWVFGAIMCPLVLFMQVLSVAVSIFTNMAIGIDRFWGVIYPLKPRLTKSRAKVVIGIIWLLAAGLAAVQLFISRTMYAQCNERWPTRQSRLTYTIVVTCVTYAVPLLILSFTYYKVGAKLWVRQTPGNAHHTRDQMMLKSKRKVVKMVVTLVVVFAVCWLPLHLFNLIIDFSPEVLDLITSVKAETVYYSLYYACHWLAMANSFTNPIIYGFLNESFRADAKSVLGCVFCCQPHGQRASKADMRMLFRWIPCALLQRDDSVERLGRTQLTRCSTRIYTRGGLSRNKPGSMGSVRSRSTPSPDGYRSLHEFPLPNPKYTSSSPVTMVEHIDNGHQSNIKDSPQTRSRKEWGHFTSPLHSPPENRAQSTASDSHSWRTPRLATSNSASFRSRAAGATPPDLHSQSGTSGSDTIPLHQMAAQEGPGSASGTISDQSVLISRMTLQGGLTYICKKQRQNEYEYDECAL